ncbi:MAG: GNAT family N-acetyltransferase [Pseudomonadota bacterium]
MDLKTLMPHKVMTAESAISRIKTGSRIFLGSGCGEPQFLIHALVDHKRLQDILIYQMLSFTLSHYVDDPSFLSRFSLKLFFISRDMRKAAFEGKIDYIPSYLSQIPRLFYSKRIGIDVALIQVSPPDRHGYCSLGVSVDITRAGMANASLVIAQVNAHMPRTRGDSNVHINEIDCFVFQDEPILEFHPAAPTDNEITRRIGRYVSQLVDDNATIQVGFGTLPNAILLHLSGKKNLGIHTQVITDAFLPLLRSQAITCKKKNHMPGRLVASLCMGSRELYDYVDDNPLIYLCSSEYVNDPTVIAQNENLISISSALEVDLTGQVCSDSVGYKFYSGIGDQVDFLRGSAMSKGGFSIIALPSTAQDGRVSRIVSHLSEGAGVATTRGDACFVVTEYGIAELQGKSIYQRVMELAQIAHPKFRAQIIELAKSRHYIFADQMTPLEDDLLFLEDYKTTVELKDGRSIDVRPLLPSDELSSRNFFYSLKDETIFYRFFYPKKIFDHKVIQDHWASVDYRKRMTLIGLIMRGGAKEIMAVASYACDEDDAYAETAFVVSERFQGLGVATLMLRQLETIARANGFQGFKAVVLRDNKAMIRVFRNQYPHLSETLDADSEVNLTMDFSLS